MSDTCSFSRSKKTKQKPKTKATSCKTKKDCQETGLNTKPDATIKSFKSKKTQLVEVKKGPSWEKSST